MRQLDHGIFRIQRPKLTGLGTHYGVLSVGVLREGIIDVVDLDRTHQLQHFESVEDWAKGRDWEVCATCPPNELRVAEHRLRQAIHEDRGYALFENNCEHFASWVVTGKRESKQIQSVVGAAIGLVAIGLIISGELVSRTETRETA